MTTVMRKVIHLDEVPLYPITHPDFVAMGIPPYDQGRVKELVSRDACGSTDLNIGMYWLDPGEVHPLHFHATASEFYFVLDGQGIFTVDDDEVRGTPGTMIYMPANTNHKIVVDKSSPLKVLYGYNVPSFGETGTVYLE
jgi:quercetin dioxygenase-like cupin family protein